MPALITESFYRLDALSGASLQCYDISGVIALKDCINAIWIEYFSTVFISASACAVLFRLQHLTVSTSLICFGLVIWLSKTDCLRFLKVIRFSRLDSLNVFVYLSSLPGSSRSGDRPKKTWCEVMEKDCQIRQMCQEDAVDCRKWRKLIKDVVLIATKTGCE